ncbi:hypothetical protein [Deinococcus altitudinis]|uniref:hypothetical protein n=1 Tax=Deinococcus altitudinis TaxID=468914 RepID=UPI00389286C7
MIQLAIMLGATVGGLIYELSGDRTTFALRASALSAKAVLGWRDGQQNRTSYDLRASTSLEPPLMEDLSCYPGGRRFI